jgi:hypothetical protein
MSRANAIGKDDVKSKISRDSGSSLSCTLNRKGVFLWQNYVPRVASWMYRELHSTMK